MTSAKALLAAAFMILTPLVSALALPDTTAPSADDSACAAQDAAPPVVWTTCRTRDGFDAGNVTVSGRADVAGPLAALAVTTRELDAGSAHVGSATVDGALQAASGDVDHLRAGDARVDGPAAVGTLQLQVATRPPACVEGTLAVVREPDGSDSLQACLRSAEGGLGWKVVGMGGYLVSMAQPHAS
jgi:hypothetical protein